QIARAKAPRVIDAQRRRALIGEALVVHPLHGVPARRRHAKLRCQQVMILRDQAHILIAGCEQHPSGQAVARGHIDDRCRSTLVVGAGPRKTAPHIPREFRQRMTGEKPHRDAVSSETAGNTNADVSAADNQGTGHRVRPTGGWRWREAHDRLRSAASDSGLSWRSEPMRSSTWRRDPRPRPTTDRVTRRAANPAPAMKRSSGPKLATAAEPTKCRPPTLDSNPADSIGRPPRRAMRPRNPGSRIFIFSTSIR